MWLHALALELYVPVLALSDWRQYDMCVAAAYKVQVLYLPLSCSGNVSPATAVPFAWLLQLPIIARLV